MMQGKFELGRTVMTRGISALCDNPAFYILVLQCLSRHVSGDWGDVCAVDKKENDRALKNGERLCSAYTITGKKVWIITERDRSYTTILFPEEY
jgi:hypothetical protein